MRLKYNCDRCGVVVMLVSYCEIWVGSTESAARLIFEDVYHDGSYIHLDNLSMSDAKRLQNQLFRDGYLDITGYVVEEVLDDEDEDEED